jgi:hypothetical protein
MWWHFVRTVRAGVCLRHIGQSSLELLRCVESIIVRLLGLRKKADGEYAVDIVSVNFREMLIVVSVQAGRMEDDVKTFYYRYYHRICKAER